jgi:integrase/recombinase XerD
MADPARAAKRVVLTGPLAKPGFAAETHRKGFAPLSAEHQVRLLAHLSRWMETYSLAWTS